MCLLRWVLIIIAGLFIFPTILMVYLIVMDLLKGKSDESI